MIPSPLGALLAFGRLARAEGLPVTTDQIENLVRALEWTGIEDRGTVLNVACAFLVHRKEDIEPLRKLFDRFWRAPGDPLGEEAPTTMPPAPRHPRQERFTVATYMAFKAGAGADTLDMMDRSGTFTAEEALRRKRFAEMTEEELAAVRRLLRGLRWDAALRITRRRASDEAGPEIDLRRVLARAARMGSVPPRLPRRRRRVKPRPLVLLADVSGSMEKYSRIVLQFFHSVEAATPSVETFVFGTRLTRITPELRARDLDRALDAVSHRVVDWAGGTRIGECLRTFNQDWGRRLLRRGAVVVVVSDGCETGEGEALLAAEMRRLQHRCHRLIWLNPYLGHERYEPRVAGMRSALPYVDDFLPADDIQSLEEFSRLLARLPAQGSLRLHGRARPRTNIGRSGRRVIDQA